MVLQYKDLDLSGTYSYADYLSWRFDEYVELIRGRIFPMSPAPSRKHQRIAGDLYHTIHSYLIGKSCQVFFAPFDVRLPKKNEQANNENIYNVVQPDISVICDLSKLDDQGCIGAPDWIIEILSPATRQKDLVEKFALYQEAGVKEYWIVHPNDATVMPYFLNEKGKYEGGRLFAFDEDIPSTVFPGLHISLGEID